MNNITPQYWTMKELLQSRTSLTGCDVRWSHPHALMTSRSSSPSVPNRLRRVELALKVP
jgi:hypothetical protein